MSSITRSNIKRTVTTRRPDAATMNLVSKLVSPDDRWAHATRDGQNPIKPPSPAALQRVVNNTATQIRDNQSILEMLPDMELCKDFMVSAIISPSDMVSTNVSYRSDTDEIPASVTTALMEEVKRQFEAEYPFEEHLEDIIANALYVKGAHPVLILPESSIDYTINSNQAISTEALKATGEIDAKGRLRNLGVLGPAQSNGDVVGSMENIFLNLDMTPSEYTNEVIVNEVRASLEQWPMKDWRDRKDVEVVISKEQLDGLGKFSVHDNYNLLKLPLVQDRIRSQRIANVYGQVMSARDHQSSMEGRDVPSNESRLEENPKEFEVKRFGGVQAVTLKYADEGELEGLDQVAKDVYPDRRYRVSPVQAVMTQGQLSRKTMGNPLILEPPTEAVIPIHVPGNPRKHIGYWLIVDTNGNFINASMKAANEGTNGCSSDPNSEASGIIDQAMLSSYGYRSEGQVVIDELARSYGSVIEADLLNRLRNGKLGSDFEIAMTQDTRHLMWTRALSKKHTVALFVPAELMVYVAVDYNDYGVGRTITESSKILAAIRANLTLASLLASIKNSTGTRTARITVPEESDNPDQDVEYMMHQHYELNNNPVSLAETNPNIMMRHIQNTGMNVVVENHPLYPDVKFEVEAREGTFKDVDRDLMEDMRKQHIQSFGLTPEQIDASVGVDFAASIFQNNLMTAKRVILLQRKIEPHLSRLVKIWTMNSSPCMDALHEICKNAKGIRGDIRGKPAKILDVFMDSLYVELPKPKTQSYKDMQDMMEEYAALLDEVLMTQANEEMFQLVSDMEPQYESVEGLRNAVKAKLMRDFIAKHNILPEANLTNTMGEGKNGAAGALFRDVATYSDNVYALMHELLEKMAKAAEKRGGGETEEEDFTLGGEDPDEAGEESGDPDADPDMGFEDPDMDPEFEDPDADPDTGDEEPDADEAVSEGDVEDLAGLPDMPEL